jgi:hypothetical protein
MHDSRRYHRTRRPTFARGYGAIAGLLGGGEAAGATGAAAGAAEGAAAGGLGSTLVSGLEAAAGPALTGLGKTAVGGIEALGQGLQSLFTGGGGEAAKLADLGQTVPAGVELVGPSSTFTGPGFLEAVHQGFTQGPAFLKQFAEPGAGTSAGAGVGQLMSALQQIQQQGGGPAKMPQVVPAQIIRPPAMTFQPRPVIPGGTGMESRAQAPIMSLLHI